MEILLSSVLLVLLSAPSVPAFTSDLETELRSMLYNSSDYNYLVRPNVLTNITVKLVVLSLNDLNIKSQILDVAGYFDLSWEDPRLSWNNSPSYSSISAIYSNDDTTWTPPLVVINSVTELKVINDDTSPIRVSPTGKLRWLPPGDHALHCDTDPTYYPFDTQTCSIDLTTWGYVMEELSLMAAAEALDTSFYRENGEWVYESYSTDVKTAQRGGQTMSVLSISLKFRRRPKFYVTNTLIPIYLLAFLSGFIFKLTPDSGEKMGFVLTVLLAYAVYLTLVAEYIPTTSDHVSVLSVLLVMILTTSVGSVVITIFVLRSYSTPDHVPMSPFMQKIARLMSKISSWKKFWCTCKGRKVDEDKTGIKENPLDREDIGYKENTWIELECETEKITWKDFALITDHFCFIVYFFIVILMCVICQSVMLYGYCNV